MAFDNRMAKSNQFSKSINFDIFKKPSTLSPVRGIEADESYADDADAIRDYDLGSFGQSFAGGTVYAFGRKTGATGVKMFSKSPTSTNWTAETATDASAVESTTGCPVPGTNVLTTFNSSGSDVKWFITNSANSLASGNRQLGQISGLSAVPADFAKKTLTSAGSIVFEPFMILGQDGLGYLFDANKVHRLNADASVTDDVFTLSSAAAWKITSACLYGSYIAMTIKGYARSRLILWDYSDAQATENVDLGAGTAFAVENLDGTLVITMDKNINTSYNSTGSSNGQGVMQVKLWDGGDPTTITEVKALANLAGATNNYHFARNNVLYWYAKIPIDAGATEFLEGIWGFGRQTDEQPWALSLHREVPSGFEVFHMQGDYTYFAHGGNGQVSRTKDDEAYGLTSTYESPVFDGGDGTDEKNFKGLSVSFEKLTSGQTVVAKYRKDGATSWTTLTPAPAVATGDTKAIYPMDGNFYYAEIRLESTNGAKINGYKLRFETLTSAIE